MTEGVLIILALTSLLAATVHGALGYGYSAISIPIALLVMTGRVLNPAVVIVEVVFSLYALWWSRRSARPVLSRVVPLSFGLVPGVIVGALVLGAVASADAKLVAYAILLPLILVQVSG